MYGRLKQRHAAVRSGNWLDLTTPNVRVYTAEESRIKQNLLEARDKRFQHVFKILKKRAIEMENPHALGHNFPEPLRPGEVLPYLINLISLGGFAFQNDPIARAGIQAYGDAHTAEHWEHHAFQDLIEKNVDQRAKDRRYKFQMRVLAPKGEL